MKCVSCQRNDVPVYRSTPKGQDPQWKCEKCLTTPPPDDVKEICDILQQTEKEGAE